MESKRNGNIRLLGIIYTIIGILISLLTWGLGVILTDGSLLINLAEIFLIWGVIALILIISFVICVMIIEMKEYKAVSDDWKHKHEVKMAIISEKIDNIKEIIQK